MPLTTTPRRRAQFHPLTVSAVRPLTENAVEVTLAVPAEPAPSVTGASELVWLYVMDAFEGGLPSARYLGLLADAAEAAGAPESYVLGLRTRDSLNVGPGA